jgi:hypothetical protein
LTTNHFPGRICALLVHILNTHDAASYKQELGGVLRYEANGWTPVFSCCIELQQSNRHKTCSQHSTKTLITTGF